MRILGIVAKTHDSGVAFLNDGVPEAILEEERFNRVKKTKKFPKLGLTAGLADLGLAWDDDVWWVCSPLGYRIGAKSHVYPDPQYSRGPSAASVGYRRL